jgi:hypothetical protein
MSKEMKLLFLAVVAIVATFLAAQPAGAIILNHSRVSRNTDAPTGSLADSGWQWQGYWGSFLGTPIAPGYFITAGHVGGNVGADFTFDGQDYSTTATFNDPQSDLEIWQINGTFPTWAPLYTGNQEAGKLMTTFGRGTDRGRYIKVNGQLKGWYWSGGDGSLSWGTNIINGAARVKTDTDVNKGSFRNGGLYWTFDRDGTHQEATLSNGDSGGGAFIKDTDGKWKLVGVNFSVDADFALPGGGGDFNAAIMDEGGLVQNGKTINDIAQDIPTRSIATRISTRTSWIDGVINGSVAPSLVAQTSEAGVPEPASLAMFALASAMLWARPIIRRR